MRTRDNKPISKGGAEVPLKRRYAMSMPENPTPPPPEVGTPSTAMITFAADWQALAEPTHAGYAQDEAHQREMLLMTGDPTTGNGLAKRADCTHVAVQDGNWTSADTWLNVSTEAFELPGAGDKLGIPPGITVTMNNNDTTAYGTLRVDGSVVYPINQDTKLYIDTIVVNHGGVWQQGTTVAPIPAAYTSIVEFTNGGAIDTSVDDLALGRGLLGMGATPMAPSNGSIKICGAEKDQWGTTSTSVSAGATTVTLDAAPTGWAIGDEIQIAATNRTGSLPGLGVDTFAPPQADNVTITDIDGTGTVITFSPATTYAHTIRNETGFTDLKLHVVNFTRNIKYRSATGAAVQRRGHVMLMGQNLDVRWASFDRMGRTVKNAYRSLSGNTIVNPSFDATNDAVRIQVEGSDVPWGSVSGNVNVRGRYNLHIHRTGILDGQPYGEVVGCSATDAPSWAFTHHQGNCNFRKCVARQFQGGGFVAEIGSEVGVWEDCYAGEIKNISGDQEFPPTSGNLMAIHPGTEKDFGTGPANTYSAQTGDLARFQSGFWLKGRAISLRRNVASGVQSGFFWMSRAVVDGDEPNAKETPEPRIFYGREQRIGSVSADKPTISEFDQCICYGAMAGMGVIKAGSKQDHNLRTHLKRFLAWNVVVGAHLEYTAYYTISDFRLLGDPHQGYATNTARQYSKGFLAGQGVVSFLWEDNTIRDFKYGFSLNDGDLTRLGEDGGSYLINNTLSNIETANYLNDMVTAKPGLFAVKTSGDIINSEATFTPFAEPVYPTAGLETSSGTPRFWLNGNTTNEFETRNRTFGTPATPFTGDHNGVVLEALNFELMLKKYGYYTYTHPTHGASNYLLMPDLISLKMQDVNGDIPPVYLTIPVRLTGISLTEYINQGAMPQRYIDAIALGDDGITDPETPAAGAAAWVVYEDILGVGGLYEGL